MKAQIIKSITALLFTYTFCFLKSEAQIIYTDVTPDDTIKDLNLSYTTYQTYPMDLNNDGVTDFDLNQSYSQVGLNSGTLCAYYKINKSCYSYPRNLNAIASNSTGGLALNALSIINGGLSWRDTSSNHGYNNLASYSFTSIRHCPPASPATGTTGGNWYNQNDKYLGVKIIKNGLTYYGWVRLQVVSASSITVKDYGYNSIPNQPIKAGEVSCTTPTVTLTASGSLSFCAGDSVTLTANGTGYQYQWTKGGVNISGGTNQSYVAKTAGLYKCKVANSCGSKTSGGKTVSIPCRNSSESFGEALEKLSVYPNPATNSVTIRFSSDASGEIQIVNLFGQIVYAKNLRTLQVHEDLNETQIDVSNFTSGMYVIRWSSGEMFETKSLSIIK